MTDGASDIRDAIPSASSPQLLTRMLELLASGLRSGRALEEALGVDGRTVRYYRQAGEWLGFLDEREAGRLTELGLEYVYRRRARRDVWRRAVWSQPFVAALLAGRGRDVPTLDDLTRAVLVVSPELAPSTARRKASGVRSLIAPGVKAGMPSRIDADRQLTLPLTTPAAPPQAPALPRGANREYHPDIYRYVLRCLLDLGELTLGQLRAVLDRAGAGDVAIGGYADIALSRGDAWRVGESLVVTPGAIARRELATTTASVLLSDPGYRAYLLDVERGHAGDRAARSRAEQRAGRYAGWDRRILGRPIRPEALRQDLRAILMDRSVEEFPVASPGAEAPVIVDEPFLYAWEQRGLLIARPSWLGALQGGLPSINAALQEARLGTADVSLPNIAHRPVAVHAGLLHPDERLPRSVPDRRTLRQRILVGSPHGALTTALLLVHRARPRTVEIHRAGRWRVAFEEKDLGPLGEVLHDLVDAAGWHAVRGPGGGLPDEAWVRALEAVGIASLVGPDQLILSERMFGALRHEAEEMEVAAQLEPLAAAMLDLLSERAASGEDSA
jgi:hypothetical protein